LGRLKRSVLITSTGASTRIERLKMSDAGSGSAYCRTQINAPQGRDAQESGWICGFTRENL